MSLLNRLRHSGARDGLWPEREPGIPFVFSSRDIKRDSRLRGNDASLYKRSRP